MRLIAVVLTILLAPGLAWGESSVTAFEAAFARRADAALPGCAGGVVRDGALVWSGGYGLADVEGGRPITTNTRFDIGSMSKQFLVMGVLMLAQEGKLSLGDEVQKYVPELPHYAQPITLANLLHHTSGLKDYDQLLQGAGWRDGDLMSAHDIFWVITRQRTLGFRPDERYSYSDSNYFLLGLIVERVSGEKLPKFLDKRVFQPLGMSETSLRTDRWALISNKAWPYSVENGKPRLFVDAEEPLGDGGIFSTVGDLAKWEANFSSGKVGGLPLVREMEAVQPLADGSPNEYAAGLYVRNYRGLRMIEHSGASYGYLAEKVRFPERGISVIVLCNRRDGPYVALTDELADAALGVAPTPMSPSGTASRRASLARFAGFYFSEDAADGVSLEASDDGIVDGDSRFRQTGPGSFASSPVGTLCRCATTYVFRSSASGDVVGFDAVRPAGPGGKIVTRYLRMQGPPTAASELTGDYVSEDLSTIWRLAAHGDQLQVCRKGFEDRPLQLLWRDAASGPTGILQFDRSAGVVSGFRLRNLRFNSVSFRRLAPGERPAPAVVCMPGPRSVEGGE